MVPEFNALRAALGELGRLQSSHPKPKGEALYRSALKALDRLSEQFEPR